MPPFMHAVIQWLLCSFIPSLIRATIHSYMYLCCNSFMASLILCCQLVIHSGRHSFMLTFIHGVIHSCCHILTAYFMASFTHAVTYLLCISLLRHSLLTSALQWQAVPVLLRHGRLRSGGCCCRLDGLPHSSGSVAWPKFGTSSSNKSSSFYVKS